MGFKIIGATALIFLPNHAFAHVGHIGEVAGHGHLIAIGATVAAAALAALVARGAKKRHEEDKSEEADVEADEPSTETA